MAVKSQALEKKKLVERLVDELTVEGEKAIKAAYGSRGFKNRLYNLHDSYASAVYSYGQLVKKSIRYVGTEMSRKGLSMGWSYKGKRSMPDRKGIRYLGGDEMLMSGREEAMDFLSQYTPTSDGVTLVIVAAMFYTTFLEKRNFRVISGARSIMEDIAGRYRGTYQEIQLGRVRSVPHSIKGKSWK